MNPETFTTVISSNNSVTANTANDCWIKLGGLPNDIEFYCEVIDFAINKSSLTGENNYIQLAVNEGMEIIGGVQFPRRFNKLCNINTTTGQMNGVLGNVFKVRNFNGRLANFQLGNPDNSLFANINRAAVNAVVAAPAIAAAVGPPIIPYSNIVYAAAAIPALNTAWTITLRMTPIKNTDD